MVGTDGKSKSSSTRRRYLTDQQMKMKCTELMAHMMCSKVTAWRAKRNGFYCPDYNGSAEARMASRRARAKLKPLESLPMAGRKIRLSKLEEQLSRNALAMRFHIGHEVASQALLSGVLIVPGAVPTSRKAMVR